MCEFITLVTDCPDIEALKKVLGRHGRDAIELANPSVQRILKVTERQYYTGGVCDCGTVLGRQPLQKEPEDLSKTLERKAKAGWSKAKIERWLANRKKAAGRPEQSFDSFDYWSKILADVLESKGTSSAGLIVHAYDGLVDDEEFAATRHEVPFAENLVAALEGAQQDELLIFLKSRESRA